MIRTAPEPIEPFGPLYPQLGATVAKFRRKVARVGAIAAMEKAERTAYGAAVEQAVLALQKTELRREIAAPPVRCASGTFHNDGESIERAVRGQQRAAIAAAAARDRKREPHIWRSMYADAMREKRSQEVTA